jgi:hypothetical protein
VFHDFTFDAIIPRDYGAHQLMRMNRQARSPWARLLAAICASLFVIATVGFPFLHSHKHSDQHGHEHCNVCVAHATASSAVAVDTEMVTGSLQTPAETFLSTPETIVSHAPITADGRGPPTIL